ncbi:MAG TPA: nuclear transport factor 2 family protein [Candidatus Acidoferrales bacterium]|nr:nuclear transport factor 2 family protein [Candidatus Acidoferrales bacterium]
METRNPTTIVLEFIDKINAADVPGLCSLISEDHVFIDALGNRVQGREKMRAGFTGYFAWFPDYRISHEEIFEEPNAVAVFGSASGTYAVSGRLPKENHWEIPAAWKAVVRNGLIAEWHVYCDNQPARKLMGEKVP